MFKIDQKIFDENLRLTQAYCDEQLAQTSRNPATIFRSIDPGYNGKPIFSFTLQKIDITPFEYYTAEWAFDPLRNDGETLFNYLYHEQLLYKKQALNTFGSNLKFAGKILVAEIDLTVLDGASEAQSEGLIDINDYPPIDTWFYIQTGKNSRNLFAWIPQPYVDLANRAIEVNCVECMHWADNKLLENEVGILHSKLPLKSTGNRIANALRGVFKKQSH